MSSDLAQSATIFNIQSYSIHDGPGIRTTVFMKGCPLRCVWCANPESNLEKPQLMIYSNKCTGCGICATVCPQHGTSLRNVDGVCISQTDRIHCTDCGTCAVKCPNEAREIAGTTMTVEQVLEKIEEDRIFFEGSGGGMTVSGGECLMHPAFTAALLRTAKNRGIHTAVESCCFASNQVIDTVFPYVDLGLLDIKHMDSETHKQYTGVPNEPILENIRHIYRDLKRKIIIRIPVIPRHNDSDANILSTATFVKNELGKDVPIHLLPYHALGESKNDSLGNEQQLLLEPPSNERMQQLKKVVESRGIVCQIGG